MKKRLSLIVSVFAIAALAAVPFVYAQGPGGHGGHGHGPDGGPGMMIFGIIDHLKSDLGLTDAQAAQIRTIAEGVRTQNEAYRNDMHDGLKQVADILLKNPNDVAAAQAVLNQQTAAETAMKTNMLNATSKALNVLTPDQRTKLAQIIAEHHDRMMQRRNGQ